MEVNEVNGATMSNGEYSAFLGGVAAGFATGAAIPSPLSPVLGAIAGITAMGSAYYAYMAA
jgi:hypothetical protein